MRIHEFGQSRDIVIDTQFGIVKGTIYDQREHFEEWLVKLEANDEARGLFSMFPDNKLLPVATLGRIYAPPVHRDNLMRLFLNTAAEAKNVVIIAHEGAKWYRKWGFTEIGGSRGRKIMMLNNY